MNPRTADTTKRPRSSAAALTSPPVVQRSCCGAESDPSPTAALGAEATGYKTAPTSMHGCSVETADPDGPPPFSGEDPAHCTTPSDAELSSRHECIAAEAYRIASQRGFAPGGELDDWLAAEAAVDQTLARHQPESRS